MNILSIVVSQMLQFGFIWCILLISVSLPKSCITGSIYDDEETIKYWSDVLTEGINNASTFTLPINADMHRPMDEKVTDYGTYDFVIIGGGTTGNVIASRLSEVKNWKVLVLEAGKYGNDFIKFPSSVFKSILSEYNWGYRSVPQKTACLGMVEQRCSAARGKGMGGTTLINGLLYQRGEPKIFDKWAEILNDSSWCYENILPLFKKFENFEHTNRWTAVDEEYHGTDGNLHVDHALPPDELTGVFLDANKNLGYHISDYNGPKIDVASVIQIYKKNGRRQDSFTAFLQPVIDRSNLKILTESFVIKIEIDNATKVTTGVQFSYKGKTYIDKANKEVILSAGVFASPKILMLSGIGPRDHLQDIGINLIEDLEVGSVLMDDVVNNVVFFDSNLYKPSQTQKEQVKDFLHGVGPLANSLASQGIGFYKSDVNNDTDFADFELFSVTNSRSDLEVKIMGYKNETYSALWGNAMQALNMFLININTYSRGSVTLASKDPFEFPLIDFNLLSDPENRDIQVLYEGIQFIFRLFETPAYQRLGVKYTGKPIPGCRQYEFLSKDYWYCFLRQTSTSAYHSKGTCPMGTNPRNGAVVDSNFSVFGIEKLRVADSSIFPTSHGGTISAACLMLGGKLSENLKSQYF